MAVNLERFISNACCNSCQSFYDHYVEVNVRFRASAGMKAVIIRRQLGNCCDWCANLAGIYNAHDMGDDIRENIYRRHMNCKCLVTYRTENGYQNVWNKKIYSSQRTARIERLNEIESDDKKYRKYDIEKRVLLSKGEHIYDATAEWFETAHPETAKIIDKDSIIINGETYIADGKYVIMDLQDYEKEVLIHFVNTFGNRLQYHPRIVYPERISTPDCLYNGERLDLKTPGLYNPGIRGKNVLFNMVDDMEEQAHAFLFDIRRTGLTRDEAIKQAEALFFRRKTLYIEKVILYDGEFFKIIERI